jgi:hypothetical protein
MASLKHCETPPAFFTTRGSKSFDLFASFINYFFDAHESKGWFYVFEVKNKIENLLALLMKEVGYLQP